MPFTITVHRVNGALPLQINLNAGDLLFVLGANGAGKSALMHRIYSSTVQNARWIQAHRQTWLSTDFLNVTAEQRRHYESNSRGRDTQHDARWRDVFAGERPTMALYDLIDAENIRARDIAKAVETNELARAQQLALVAAPLTTINRLLKSSSLSIELALQQNDRVVARKGGSSWFSLQQLSDGERNAILLASAVLTFPAGSLILLDEPERHLHRSIISPLLTSLAQERRDCTFVVATHDVMLPIDNPAGQTLFLRNCSFDNGTVNGWDADLVPAATGIDDGIRQDILGARRRVLFVEGTNGSLDKPLYGVLFSDISIIAKASCRDVEHAVTGIRETAELHWARPFGVVDNDRRTTAEIAELQRRGVYAIPAFSVESLYYHAEVQRRVVDRHVRTIGGADRDTRMRATSEAVVESIRPHVGRLAARVVDRRIREQMMRQLPGIAEIAERSATEVRIDVASVVTEERTRLEAFVAAGDFASIVREYPIRETPALSRIATELGFQDRKQYESAVIKLLADDDEARRFVRNLLGDLPAAIDTR